jgi:hypothetical protein
MEQTEPSAMTWVGVFIGAAIDTFIPKDTPKSRHETLKERIEEATLYSRNGRSYHKGLHQALGDNYSASEIDRAIRALRRTRVLNEHRDGPDDISYSHNNRIKTFFAGLDYIF